MYYKIVYKHSNNSVYSIMITPPNILKTMLYYIVKNKCKIIRITKIAAHNLQTTQAHNNVSIKPKEQPRSIMDFFRNNY